MCILMLFNDVDKLSYREIADATEIPPADLKRSLQSLACAKVGGWVQWPCAASKSSKCSSVTNSK
jgi:hypothetical protein